MTEKVGMWYNKGMINREEKSMSIVNDLMVKSKQFFGMEPAPMPKGGDVWFLPGGEFAGVEYPRMKSTVVEVKDGVVKYVLEGGGGVHETNVKTFVHAHVFESSEGNCDLDWDIPVSMQ